uniref:Zinc finger CCHC domain-containing protein 7 n=1 Tax=Oryzias melastigma TaxID=30732 RepID=A0A3B3B931_ORYME
MIVIRWIHSSAQRWRQFVANRVEEIQSLTTRESWPHCSGKLNPADLITRGQTVSKLKEAELWWARPQFLDALTQPESPLREHREDEVKAELKHLQITVHLGNTETRPAESLHLEKYSKIKTVLRVTAWIKRFAHNCRSRAKRQGELTAEEIVDAERHWILVVQRQSYQREIFSAKQNWEEWEDELYRDDENSEESVSKSELEFHLYSQLHYSSNAGELDNKPKQRKSKPNGSKLLSSFFEEVIVSGPDVITIFDDSTEDTDGACSSKGGALPKQQTSTPAQQHTKTRSRSPAVPVAVLSSSSESETRSDLSDSSDSEDLENWMILGQGKREEDQSISLHSNTDAGEGCSWWVSEKDMEVQIHNKDRTSRTARQPKRYFTWKNIHCRNCNKTGHLSKSCPEPKKLVLLWFGVFFYLNCGQPGHAFGTCSEIAYSEKQCHRCGMKGHFSDAGPEIWRQYHLTTTNGPPVTAENCSFSSPSQMPSSIKLPKKKQKINTQMNSTPNPTHKSTPNHIYLKDEELRDETSSTKTFRDGAGSAKLLKPKRPFPASRNPPAKPVLDEDCDFPRGGRPNKKRRRRKSNKLEEINRRQDEIKIKAPKMQENCSFASPSQTPSSIKPPKKI